MSDERIKKLPVWARTYIAQLETKLRDATDKSEITDDYRAPGLHFGMGFDAHRFMSLKNAHGSRLVLEDGQQFSFYIGDAALGVNFTDRTGRRLAVQPNAANSVELMAMPEEGRM